MAVVLISVSLGFPDPKLVTLLMPVTEALVHANVAPAVELVGV